jgi:hypothetical protein
MDESMNKFGVAAREAELKVAQQWLVAITRMLDSRPRHGTYDRYMGGCDCPQCITCQNPDTSPRDY